MLWGELKGTYNAEGIKAIADAIVRGSLASIDISNNNLGDEGKRVIAKAIPTSALQSFKCDFLDLQASATSLNLWSKNLGAADAKLLAAAMTKFMGSLSFIK